MALDKQRILSELGSVMNKLQSADCGCMGKLFSNQQGSEGGATMGSPLPTSEGCRHGCCHGRGNAYSGHNRGYNVQCAGEPHSNPGMGMQCNPAKLYADTYNYLNTNLMQPVVNEVYQDLKSINPTNSVVNNPNVAGQMGLQQGGAVDMHGNIGMDQNHSPGSDMGMENPKMSKNQPMGNMYNMGNQQMGHQQMGHQQMGQQQMGYQQMGNQQMGNQQMGNQQLAYQQMGNKQMSQMEGMGENIINMMQSHSKSQRTGHLTAPMATNASQDQVPRPGTIHSQYNTEMNDVSSYGGQQARSQYMQPQNASSSMNTNTQNTMGGKMQHNIEHPGASYQVNYSNPAAQQMSSKRGHQNYGKHTPGMTKFNEMFPGIMSGELGFDPMSIAFQMNPANQKQCVMNQMQRLMNGSSVERGLDSSTNARSMQPIASQLNIAPSSQQQQVQPGRTQQNQGYTNTAANQPNQAQQVYGQVPQQQQQVYTAMTGAPTMNQNQPPQQYQQLSPQQYQQHPPQRFQKESVNQNEQQYQLQNVDPNAQAMVTPDTSHLQSSYVADPNASLNQEVPQSYNAPPSQSYSIQPPSPAGQQMIREPILPVDTSKNQPQMKHEKFYEYNTLGQPVEMLPAKLYHPAPDTTTQQTLSPQHVTNMRPAQSRFTVKNTVSKTSLMGNRPVGRTPSRGQLQQIYNQYKGSHSYTQQNIRSPVQGATYSEGKINVAQANSNQPRHVPVERVAGDTLANNQISNNQAPVASQPLGHTGDVPVSVDKKPHGDIEPAALPSKKIRNGLQDMVYTSYPTSARWSFHGNDRSLHTPGYHLRR